MGIDCRLRRAKTADWARRDPRRAVAELVRAAAVGVTGSLGRCRELCGADSRHKGAMAEREAVGARNRVGGQGRMACSRRVEGCAVKLNCGRTCHDVQSAAFALGA